MIASGAIDSVVRLWNVSSGKLDKKLCGHKTGSHSVAFSPDGKILATASSTTASVRLWTWQARAKGALGDGTELIKQRCIFR